jgi:hypothetical protein
MAWDGDAKLFRNVAIQRPRIHDLDHRAIVATIKRGQPGQLKLYHQRRQRFPLQLPPVEEQDQQTRLFGELRKTCEEDAPTKRKRNDWLLEESWRLIAHRAMLRHTGCLCQAGGRRLHCQIGASLRKDRADRTANVGALIELELAGGNVQEAFRHLKGWYWAASDTQAKPCRQTMERQTSEQIDLYTRRDSPGNPLPINVAPTEINNDVPSDGELRGVVGELSNGQAAGASGMRAEHVKKWLHDVQQEEDPEGQGAENAGDRWRLFVRLVQAAWTHGKIPRQLL